MRVPHGWAWGVMLGVGFLTVAAGSAQAQSGRSSTDTDVGYIDTAIPATRFRLRYDSAYDDNRPDRAEFFYSQYQQQTITGLPGSPLYVNTPPTGRVATSGGNGGSGGGGPGPNRGGNDNFIIASPGDVIGNPAAKGLPKPETKVDYQELSAYFEVQATNNFSAFVELPVRFLNPELNDDAAGFGDMNAGFKWAFFSSPDFVSTFQLRTYIPTGDSTQGLGTNHVSLEPALLWWLQLSEGFLLEGELRDWVPIGGTDFEGNVLRYGLGLSYAVYNRPNFRITPVVEFVGWTVMDGKETVALSPTLFTIKGAGGDTIVNGKFGVRTAFGQFSDVYIGYGRALTGDVWYKDILRLEYRVSF